MRYKETKVKVSEDRVPEWPEYGGKNNGGTVDNCRFSHLSNQRHVIPLTLIRMFKGKTKLLRKPPHKGIIDGICE